MSRSRQDWGDRGAAAVEFAIVVPLLLLILLGLVDFGRMFYVQVSLNAASREGARSSSLRESAGDVTAIARASSPRTAQLSKPGSTTLTVSSTACPSAPTVGTTSVTVSTPFQFFTPLGLLNWYGGSASGADLDLTSTSVMQCLG